MTMQLTDRPTMEEPLGHHRRIRTHLVPASAAGRVRGRMHTLVAGVMPLGVVLGGVVSELWGPVGVLVCAGTLCLAVLVHPVLTTSQRRIAGPALAASERAPDDRFGPMGRERGQWPRRFRSVDSEAAAAKHRAEATERLFRAGIQHLR